MQWLMNSLRYEHDGYERRRVQLPEIDIRAGKDGFAFWRGRAQLEQSKTSFMWLDVEEGKSAESSGRHLSIYIHTRRGQ